MTRQGSGSGSGSDSALALASDPPYNDPPTLFPCEPLAFLWMPHYLRRALGAASMTMFALTFMTIPSLLVFATPYPWRHLPYVSAAYLGLISLSMVVPSSEWVAARKFGQLWYEILNFSCNLDPDSLETLINEADNHQYIIAMHPHGVIPFHAILWSAYCDQYLTSGKSGKALYGFGAAADVVMYLPFLRNIMAWLSAGSAAYKTLKEGLEKGISASVNANKGRKPRHLYLLPGGIAEIFTSTPKKHTIVLKKRKGLMRLSLETGAEILPCYVFGGTDFFHNLATGSSGFSQLCRKFRIGVTLFWGQFLLVPFFPRVSLCIAEPIAVKKWEGNGPIPDHLIDELHGKYMKSISDLFEKYKSSAGYPDGVLDIQ